jgi:sortase (surface protein transpeptidase)
MVNVTEVTPGGTVKIPELDVRFTVVGGIDSHTVKKYVGTFVY